MKRWAQIHFLIGLLVISFPSFASLAYWDFENGDVDATPNNGISTFRANYWDPSMLNDAIASQNGGGEAENFGSLWGTVHLTRTFGENNNFPYITLVNTSSGSVAVTNISFLHFHNHNTGHPTNPNYDIQLQADSGSGYADAGSPFTVSSANNEGAATITFSPSLTIAPNSTLDLRWIPRNLNGDTNTGSEYFALDQVTVNDVALDASAACSGNDLTVTINGGDGPFDLSYDFNGTPQTIYGLATGTYTYTGPGRFSNIVVQETTGSQVVNLGAHNCGAGINVSLNETPMQTSEAGDTASFDVVLRTQPGNDVTIGLSSNDTTEGTVPTSITFTPGNWNVPQTVTVTGVDDSIDDGDIAFTVITATATSNDADYNGIDPDDVAVTNIDDDTAGISVTPTAGLTTGEDGTTATFNVVLDSEPTANVVINLASSDTTEGTVPASITFAPGNWNVPQTVTVTGVDDSVDDGDVSYSIQTSVTSTDATYAAIDPDDVVVTNIDDDTAGISVTPNNNPMVTTEAGGSSTIDVMLDSEPTATVTIAIASSDTSEGVVSPATLTFTAANWNVAQTVTVTGVDDFVDDGNQLYNVTIGPASSADSNYDNLSPIVLPAVSIENIDDDTAGITVTPTSGLTTDENGGTAQFTVVLDSQPLANVEIALTPTQGLHGPEGIPVPDVLLFTPINWNQPQTVTVIGQADNFPDGDMPYQIITEPAVSNDPLYDGMDAADVNLVNINVAAQSVPTLSTWALMLLTLMLGVMGYRGRTRP